MRGVEGKTDQMSPWRFVFLMIDDAIVGKQFLCTQAEFELDDEE
jgi:hypothetical protein